MSINVSQEIQSVTTVKEFDAIVERMKVSHPLKYEARLASGDLEKQRNALLGHSAEQEPEVKKAEAKAKAKTEKE